MKIMQNSALRIQPFKDGQTYLTKKRKNQGQK